MGAVDASLGTKLNYRTLRQAEDLEACAWSWGLFSPRATN